MFFLRFDPIARSSVLICFVTQDGSQPLLNLNLGHVLSSGVALYLVLTYFIYAEVLSMWIGKVETTH